MNYRKLNDIVGWVIFAVAFVTYFLTVSPTASFWDCGEFIAVSNELEVPHPPGAPMFLLLGRLFAIFAGGDVTKVAFMINLLSVVSSAFTALFTFWVVTALGRKALGIAYGDEPEKGQTIGLLFAGAVGGLTCTFADSVWFNAVEAEVYAMSSFFTAIVVWLMLKWEARADRPDHFKWIILIAYVMGVSIGVHLLNLLCIPALGAMYYFRKYKFSWAGFLTAMGVSVVILGIINSTIIKTTFDLAWSFEKIFTGAVDLSGEVTKTSGMGMPFGTGALIFTCLALAFISGLLYYSYKRRSPAMSTAVLSTIMIYMGLSSYAMIMIRAKVNAPINENNPSNILNFLTYMKREQYGEWPILKGEMYNARVVDVKQGEPMYYKFQNTPNPKALGAEVSAEDLSKRYVAYDKKPEYEYSGDGKRFFPRMHSSQHYTGKGYWGYENHVRDKGDDPNDPYDDNVTGVDNLKYFFGYQLNYMYVRYFLWNFVGREGDEQFIYDDWESGLGFSKLNKLPDYLKHDPSRNHYFFLPLLLGIFGIAWQYRKNKQDAAVVGLLFFFTGLAIILYLNQPPQQPRERDYSYAGSFQTFAIWIGLGALALYDYLRSLKGIGANSPYIAGPVCLLAAPGIMGAQNWFDHSRAGNYVAPDSARNILESCAPNAILFTNGDNDTFPLWYVQEVEGVREDIRIVNLSLLNTDWYVSQLKTQCNKSAPLPITLDESEYMGEKNAMKVFENVEMKKVLPVDRNTLLQNKVISPADTAGLASQMEWTIKLRGSKRNPYLQKQDLLIVNMLENIAKDGWKRPFYFAITIPPSSYLNLTEYFQLEGMAYRVTPVKHKVSRRGDEYIAKDIMYENLMKKFWFRNLDRTDVFYDSNIRRMVGNFRHNYVRLASAYADDADELEFRVQMAERMKDKNINVDADRARVVDYRKRAKEVMDYIRKKITDESVRTENYYLAQFARLYAQIGEKETARKLMDMAYKRSLEELDYSHNVKENPIDENDFNVYTLQVLYQMYKNELKDYEAAKKVAQSYQAFTGDGRMLKDLERKQGAPEPPPAMDTAPAQEQQAPAEE